MNTPDSQTEKIRNLIEKFPTAMLITHDADRLHARPMAVADVGEDCTLWFITGDYTTAAWEVACQKQAHVVFQNDHSAYLSISGEASLVHDRERVREVWKESFRTWFPDGKDDPGLVLISFHPDRAEYWDNTGFKRIAYLWEAARAYVSGDTPRVKEGDQHGVVQFP